MIVDSHCHLNYFSEEEIPILLKNCEENGVMCLQNISVKLEEFEDILLPCKTYNNIFCSIGLHPCYVKNDNEDIISILKKQLSGNEKHIIGIGETGLDKHHDQGKNLQNQQKSFEQHIQFCSETNLPIIVHTRNADTETDQMFNSFHSYDIKGLIHCFCSDKAFAKKMLDKGLYISFSGILTFKNAKEIQEAAKFVPIDRIIVETDSPYLSPVPHRGKRNQPSYTKHVVDFLAQIKGVSTANITSITTENFCKLFNVQKHNLYQSFFKDSLQH